MGWCMYCSSRFPTEFPNDVTFLALAPQNIQYLHVTSPLRPTGPRAWIHPVLTPSSAPEPERKPSVPAESTPRTNVLPAEVDSVMMKLVWCEPCSLMCTMATAREGTVLRVAGARGARSCRLLVGLVVRGFASWGDCRSIRLVKKSVRRGLVRRRPTSRWL
jgi:hypothetical protein